MSDLNRFFDDALAYEGEGSGGGGRQKPPHQKGLLCVVKSWEVTDKTFDNGGTQRQLSVRVDVPKYVSSAEFWPNDDIYLTFPATDQPDNVNKARAINLASIVKGLKLSVKNGLDGIGSPSPSPVGIAFTVDKTENGKYTNWRNFKLADDQPAKPSAPSPAIAEDELPF